MQVTHDRTEVDAQVLATTPALQNTEGLEFLAGSFFDEFEGAERLPVVVLGNSIAGELRLEPGRAVGEQVTIDRRPYTVIGVLDELGASSFVQVDQAVIMPLETARGTLNDREPDYDSIMIMLCDGRGPETTHLIIYESN